MRYTVCAFFLAATAQCSVWSQTANTSFQHTTVYREDGRFAGWPANHGAWSWGNEMVVGFEIGYFRQTDRGHAIDYSRPEDHVLARSLDGGLTWTVERPESLQPPEGSKVAGVPVGTGGKQAVDCPGGIPFDHPDFALTARMEDIHVGPSRFYYSIDRGRSWEGPFRVPNFGHPGIAARTDYLVEGRESAALFLTAAKANSREGRVILVRTDDGGKNWSRVSLIGGEPEGRGYSIMPASVRVSSNEILTLVRRRGWIESFRSPDNGTSWTSEGKVADTGGNPPNLVKLEDGRLVLVYGYRKDPFGIRARVSDDHGKSWNEEIILRQDGGNWDLGYPRTLQRPDGKLVTVYYFNEDAGKERYIAATIWEPPPLK